MSAPNLECIPEFSQEKLKKAAMVAKCNFSESDEKKRLAMCLKYQSQAQKAQLMHQRNL